MPERLTDEQLKKYTSLVQKGGRLIRIVAEEALTLMRERDEARAQARDLAEAIGLAFGPETNLAQGVEILKEARARYEVYDAS